MEQLIDRQRQLLVELERQLKSKKATVIEVSETVIEINKSSSAMLVECQKRLDGIS